MAELIDKGALLKKFNDAGVHIEFDLPVEEILGEDVDIDDFAMLVQDAIQAYRKMVIGTIQNQPTTTEAEIRAKAIDEFVAEMFEIADGNRNGNMFVWCNDIKEIAEQLRESE